MRERVQRTNITFEILTKGAEPLKLSSDVQDQLLLLFERAVGANVDLRYANEHGGTSTHTLLGVDIKDIS